MEKVKREQVNTFQMRLKKRSHGDWKWTTAFTRKPSTVPRLKFCTLLYIIIISEKFRNIIQWMGDHFSIHLGVYSHVTLSEAMCICLSLAPGNRKNKRLGTYPRPSFLCVTLKVVLSLSFWLHRGPVQPLWLLWDVISLTVSFVCLVIKLDFIYFTLKKF